MSSRRHRCHRCRGTGTVLNLRTADELKGPFLPREELCPNPQCLDGWIDGKPDDIKPAVIWSGGQEPGGSPRARGGPLAPLIDEHLKRRRTGRSGGPTGPAAAQGDPQAGDHP